MKVLYDHQIFTTQKYGGISRYFYELIKYFNKNSNIIVDMPFMFSNNYYIQDKKDVNFIQFLPRKEFKGKNKLIYPVNKFISIHKIKIQNYNLFHPTYYDTYFLKYIKDKPFVLTVYDMIHEKFPSMFKQNNKISEQKRLLVEKATKIIAISQSTKNDLMNIFHIDESKIEVVYLANSMNTSKNSTQNIKTPDKYILFVGSRGGYKNFDRFIKGISKLFGEDVDLSLVCAGGGKFNNNELNLLKELNIEKKTFQYDINDDLLAYYYSKAEMFVFPSLYEGFGIPVLESFACKCPLVCSSTSSLPEIALDAAEYFDPYSETSIYTAIKNLLDNKEKRETLINKGTERLNFFSWKKTTEQTIKIYESIL